VDFLIENYLFFGPKMNPIILLEVRGSDSPCIRLHVGNEDKYEYPLSSSQPINGRALRFPLNNSLLLVMEMSQLSCTQ
jgi:hypothetical protein